MKVAGIMSGTSLDGIDVALVEIRGKRIQTLGFTCVSYPLKVRDALLAVSNCPTHTRDIARLHFLLPELYAQAFFKACSNARIKPASIQLIGCHGQTIYHEGSPAPVLGHKIASTLQIGDGSVLAERTGIPVVSDFRPSDIAAGGQGAPLVPYVDHRLLRHPKKSRAVLNIGGVANVTFLSPSLVAFDTGPGNMVIDQLVAHFSAGKKRFDRNGAWAARGFVDASLLARLLSDPYYSEKPPKTAGREQFGREFVARLLTVKITPEDLLATVTALTAASIAEGIYRFHDEPFDEVIVSGGGVHNKTLMRFLAAELPVMRVVSSAEFGIDPDAKEAIAFAILAHETWHKRPSNVPAATGARHTAVLGKVSY